MSQNTPINTRCAEEYTVKRGDSFYLIAHKLGVPLRDLLAANSEIHPARLMVGDVLCIPTEEDDKPREPLPETPAEPEVPIVPEEPPEEPLPEEDLDKPATEEGVSCPDGSPYTLLPGETVADVQLKTDLNRHTLQSANPATDLDSLAEGQTLCVPSANKACPTPNTYTLQQEDTIESVALRLNTSLSALLRQNPCLAPSEFTAGRCIYIP